MTTLATKLKGAVGRSLKTLVPLIRDELAEGNAAGLEHYRRAGVLLLEAREQVAAHQWGRWLSKNFELSRTTAFYYMKLAQRSEPLNRLNNQPQTLREALGKPRSSADQPSERRWRQIRDFTRKVAVEDFKQEQQQREDETQLHRDLALQLIDIGYRALATRLHPDRGGSKEAMARLNRVRDELKGVAETRRFL